MAPADKLSAVQRLVRESVAQVDAIAPTALRSLLPALQQARDELRGDLQRWLAEAPDAGERFTGYQRARALRALEGSLARIGDLDPAMARALAQGREATGPLSIKNLDTEIQRLSSLFGDFRTMPQIDTAAVIAEGNKLLWKRHATSARRYAGAVGDDIKNLFAVGVAKGETFEQLVTRLRRLGGAHRFSATPDPGSHASEIADGLFIRHKYWADRLVRTELMHGYNTQHDVAIKHANENRIDGDDEYVRRWDASADRVTCPRCKALHGTTSPIDGVFQWGIKAPPAHPYCRCTVLAWLARWGDLPGETVPVDMPHKPKALPEPPPKAPPTPTATHAPENEPDPHTATVSATARGDLAAAREGIRRALDAKGMRYKTSSTSTRTEVADLPKGIGGWREWDGTIKLARHHAEGAQEFAKKWEQNPAQALERMQEYRKIIRSHVVDGTPLHADWKAIEGEKLYRGLTAYNTHVHEMLHGYGPMTRERYSGSEAHVEEVTTEVAARRLIREQFGIDMNAFVSKNGKPHLASGGAYEAEIQETFSKVRAAYPKLSRERAWSLFERACDDVKQYAESRQTNINEAFGNALQRLSTQKEPKHDRVGAAKKRRASVQEAAPAAGAGGRPADAGRAAGDAQAAGRSKRAAPGNGEVVRDRVTDGLPPDGKRGKTGGMTTPPTPPEPDRSLPAGARLGSLRRNGYVMRGPDGRWILSDHGLRYFAEKKAKEQKRAETEATCQICERTCAVVGGKISTHGYSRPGWGFIVGECRGSRRLPWEVSCDAVGEWIAELRRLLTNTEAALAAMPNRATFAVEEPITYKDVTDKEREQHGIGTSKVKVALGKYYRGGKLITRVVDVGPSDARFDAARAAEERRLLDLAERLREDISRQSRRLASWKPAKVA